MRWAALPSVYELTTASANTYLDALAPSRYARGLVCACLQVPLIRRVGMGAAAIDDTRAQYLGLFSTAPEDFGRCLCALLSPLATAGHPRTALPWCAARVVDNAPDRSALLLAEAVAAEAVAAVATEAGRLVAASIVADGVVAASSVRRVCAAWRAPAKAIGPVKQRRSKRLAAESHEALRVRAASDA